MANEKLYNPREVCTELAKAINEKVTAYAADFEKLRKRELRQANKRLKKNTDAGMCPTCGNVDAPGSCTCLRKNSGSVPKTPGLQPVGPGSDPMAKCGGCGKPHPIGKCMGKSDDLWDPSKEDDGKVRGSVLARQNTTPKAAAPKKSAKDIRGVSPEQMKGPIKPFGKEEKAAGAKLPPKSPKVAEASEGSGGEVKDGKKLEKAAMPPPIPKAAMKPTSKLRGTPAASVKASVAAKQTVPLGHLKALLAGQPARKPMAPPGMPGLTAPKTAPPTSVATANKELGGFQSIASSPTAMPGGKLVGGKSASTVRGTPGSVLKHMVAAKDAAMQADDATTLAEDKKAAGVGFVNALMTRIKGRGNATWEAMRGAGGPKVGFGRTAAAAGALARSEGGMEGEGLEKSSKQNDLGNCAFCSKSEHPGDCS